MPQSLVFLKGSPEKGDQPDYTFDLNQPHVICITLRSESAPEQDTYLVDLTKLNTRKKEQLDYLGVVVSAILDKYSSVSLNELRRQGIVSTSELWDDESIQVQPPQRVLHLVTIFTP